MKIGEIRELIKQATIAYSIEKNVKKKEIIELSIAYIITLIKNKLGDFASVADDLVSIDCSILEQSYADLKKILQN